MKKQLFDKSLSLERGYLGHRLHYCWRKVNIWRYESEHANFKRWLVITTLKEEKFVKKVIKLEIPEKNDIENFWRIKDATLSADLIRKEVEKKREVFIISFKKKEML